MKWSNTNIKSVSTSSAQHGDLILYNFKLNLIWIAYLTRRHLELHDYVAYASVSHPVFLLISNYLDRELVLAMSHFLTLSPSKQNLRFSKQWTYPVRRIIRISERLGIIIKRKMGSIWDIETVTTAGNIWELSAGVGKGYHVFVVDRRQKGCGI